MCTKPNYKNLTSNLYGKPTEKQNEWLQGLVQPHIDSFNGFVHEGLRNIIQNLDPVQFALPNGDRVSVRIEDAIIKKPQVPEKTVGAINSKVYPKECRGRGVSYKAPLLIQIGLTVNDVYAGSVTKLAGNLPIMVKSDVCNLANLSPAQLIQKGEEQEEMGGYFIINGIEKCIRMLVLQRRNFPLCIKRPSWKSRGPLFTEFGITMRCAKVDHSATNMVLHYLSNGTCKLCFYNKAQVYYAPIAVILKGLVDKPDKYIYNELIKGREDDSFYKSCVVSMLREALQQDLTSQHKVLGFLGSRFRAMADDQPPWATDQDVGRQIFRKCICSHLNDNQAKFDQLVYMTQKLFVFVKGGCAEESPDSPMFQDVLMAGHLVQMQLKSKLESFLTSVKYLVNKSANSNKTGPMHYKMNLDALQAVIKSPDVCKAIEFMLATGNIDARNANGLMQTSGLSIVADKLNFMRFVSHFRVVHRGAFFGEMRTTGVRKLLPEAWGFLCPVHTPDGTPCGLMNHATALCKFMVYNINSEPVLQVLTSLGVAPVSDPPCAVKDCYTVVLDGTLVGYIPMERAESLVNKLRYMKVKKLNKVPNTMEICLVPKREVASQYPGVYLFTSAARMIRPVRNLALDAQEMIGTFEQVYMDICITQNEAHEGVTTHQELDDVTMLSFAANLTPFSDFNQSPRNMYQCQMGKQTMGFPCHTIQNRSDNKLYKIQTPQCPMVRPTKYDEFDMDNYPLGTNAIVAVISYTGYDMEDAMVINKGSYQRGFCHGSIYKTELIDLCDIQKSGVDKTVLTFGCKMDSDVYKKGQLDQDGLPHIGKKFENGMPYCSYINTHTGEQHVKRYKSNEPAWVEHIKVLGNDTGTNMNYKVAIMWRIDRNPIIGDKFASRHGQKGVCSMMYPVENMPFTESGMTPDIIFNPHGYPSRMTIGMMIESMAGKSAATFGDCYDATPFQYSEDDSAIEHFGNLLVKAGYNYYGTERFYSGVDGREMEADIFMGVVYYQRLRHMVSDKFQVRTTGSVDPKTLQPIKGRKRHGGVRFGEMERDALISHGTSFLLQDRLFNCSDKAMAPVCVSCGNLLCVSTERLTVTEGRERQRKFVCPLCHSSDHIEIIAVPSVFVYLNAELAAMNIRMSLQVKDVTV